MKQQDEKFVEGSEMKKHTSLVKKEDKEIKLMRKLEMKSMIDSQVERHHQSLRE
jgi:hypothetical protein